MEIKKILLCLILGICLIGVTACGLVGAFTEMFTDSETVDNTPAFYNQKLNYREIIALKIGKDESEIDDEDISKFFMKFFVSTESIVTQNEGLQCGNNKIYYIDSSGIPQQYTDSSVSVKSVTYSKVYSPIQIRVNGDFLYISIEGKPNHPSGFYMNDTGSHQCDSSEGFSSGDVLGKQRILVIPIKNRITYPLDTIEGPVGIALNGVSFYNSWDSEDLPEYFNYQAYKDEYNGFSINGEYHYNYEPFYLTGNLPVDSEYYSYKTSATATAYSLIGFANDGFPIFGPKDSDGHYPKDLDGCRGHVSNTKEFGEIYHYHVVDYKHITSWNKNSNYIINCFSGSAFQ
ncbi:hypothetical protein DID78_04135 [Candidatus Marinamargulisbacteria bacterium SCGC AG-343-D04]|nr:hypothetical protein DID78_04135 [Candidatus Marinamargulisbacteria bacterium SCGC AG-343-D04]